MHKPFSEFFRNTPGRLLLFYPIFIIVFLFLTGGLGWRQIFQREKLEHQAIQQSMRRILQPGTRGNIYDRHGKLLVGNRPVFNAVIFLGELRSEFREEYVTRAEMLKNFGKPIERAALRRQSRAAVLQRYLNEINRIIDKQLQVDPHELDRHFSQQMLLPYPLVKDLDCRNYARLIEHLPLNSPIQIYTQSARYYPYGRAAAHVLGFVGASFDVESAGVPGKSLTTFQLRSQVGKSGLEKTFDSYLQGCSGGEIWQVDPAGFQYKLLEKKLPTQGNNLHTSLDIELQIVAEEALGEKTGAVVVLDVATGEVLAMVSHPSYDLNELTPFIPKNVYARIDEQGGWLNRCTQGLYPPGSPFKVITAVAALRSGVIDANTHIECTGKYRVGNRLFPCQRRWGHGCLDLTDTLAYSCNPYCYEAAIKTGPELLAAEARAFGLSKPTDIELPYENKGMVVPTPEWKKDKGFGSWTQGDTANMAIGQGYLLATPLQIGCLAVSIARGQRTAITPTLLHGNTLSPPWDGVRPTRPLDLSAQDYALILEGMQKAVSSGTSKRAFVPGITVAAKTGTAQTYVQGGKKERDLAWWMGFAPVESPKIAIAIMIGETSDEDCFGGGSTSAPIAKAIIETALLRDR